jgi:hypothetical protein
MPSKGRRKDWPSVNNNTILNGHSGLVTGKEYAVSRLTWLPDSEHDFPSCPRSKPVILSNSAVAVNDDL